MIDYDLLVLSPNEFEDLSRDLLQEKNEVFIESFKTGKDGGIDLRYAEPKGKSVIVQSKRYSTYTSLIANLKKEVPKVKSLSPEQYLITTTVNLSPANKSVIKQMFHPYILKDEDILGKKDLNNLISKHKSIEEKYYKLWITSVTILNKVLHSKIYNQSHFELEEIKDQVKLYVQNKSFNEALDILNKHRYIVISGIPGIGKTTLSRLLTIYLLANDFEEFVYLSDNIDDGYKYFKEGAKQIFLFDDFLGRNFFDAKNLPKNDDKIVKFIQQIQKSPDKVLILATREYILNQAKLSYEAFEIHNIEIAKCILDLSSYTKVIKAKIFYNHLFYGKVPSKYLDDILLDERYLKLIAHKNYNPRIIETIIKRKIWDYCEPSNFYDAIKQFFDNPESVWLQSFENSLDKVTQYTLLVLATIGTPILIEDLERGVKNFITTNNYKLLIAFDSIKFRRSIKELENTFIRTDSDHRSNITVDYQNPSIHDFLINYIRGNKELINDLISSFIYIEQFTTIFTTSKTTHSYSYIKKIKLTKHQIELSVKTIIAMNSKYVCAGLYKFDIRDSDRFYYQKKTDYFYRFLNDIHNEYASHSIEAADLVSKEFEMKILFQNSFDNYNYFNLLKQLDLKALQYEENQIIDSYVNKMAWLSDIDYFRKFEDIFPKSYEKSISSEKFKSEVYKIVDSKVKDLDNSELDDVKDTLERIEANYNLNLDSEIQIVKDRSAEFEEFIDHQINMSMDERHDEREYSGEIQDNIIIDIFSGLNRDLDNN